MTTDWKANLPFLTAKKKISHKIRGAEINFYEISTEKIFLLKNLAGPVGKLLSAIQWDRGSNTASETTRFAGDADGPAGETIKLQAIDPRLEKQQAERRERAISELIMHLTSDDNIGIAASILMDSMADQFPRESNNKPTAKEFFAEVPLPILGEMVKGVWLANKEVFGPLGVRIEAMMDQKMAEILKTDAQEVSERAGTTEAAPQTLGSISPTTSNSSSQEDMTDAGS